ncbi:UNVERIFIED_CONTAM: hypothetical protein HDU68_008845 [Siphonaria sp. JEL0065]|nr:hypothetical protein HDU68_008845 [Siphonaria sp. JEL0065]
MTTIAITSESVHQFLRSSSGSVSFAVAAHDSSVLVQRKEAAFCLWALRRCQRLAKGEDRETSNEELEQTLSFLLSTLQNARSLTHLSVSANESVASLVLTLLTTKASDNSARFVEILLLADRVAALKPSLDQWLDLAAASCLLTATTALPLIALILNKALAALKTNPNQKKIFQQVLSKLLLPLLKLRHWLLPFSHSAVDPLIQTVLKSINAVLESVLFHKEHIPEFVTTLHSIVAIHKNISASLSDVCVAVIKNLGGGGGVYGKNANKEKEKTAFSYPKQFFDVLLEALRDGPKDYLVHAFPYLLTVFIDSRKRHFKIHDTNLVFSADFACFVVLFAILIQTATRGSISDKKNFVESISKLMLADSEWSSLSASVSSSSLIGGHGGIVGRLIHVLVDKDVYKATQDDVSKAQLALFKDINSVFIQVIGKLDGSHQGVVFDVLGSLMQIEHAIVLDSIDALWCFLILPDEKSHNSALEFTILLLQTLTKSRELESFLQQSFNVLIGLSKQELSRSILLEDRFLKAFSTSVTKTLPAQLPHLLTFLMSQFFAPSDSTSPQQKRRATTDSVAVSTTLAVPECITILTEFLSRLIKSGVPKVSSAPALKLAFDQRLDELFETVIRLLESSPSPPTRTTPKKRSHDDATAIDNTSKYFVDALSLLHSMMQASEEFWKRKIGTEFILKVVGSSQSNSTTPQEKLLKVRVALFHAECVASNSLDPKLEKLTADLVTVALESVFVDGGTVGANDGKWDGNVKGLTEGNLGVALWACLLDHLVPIWLSSSHLASQKQIEQITETLIDTIKTTRNHCDSEQLQVQEGQYTLRLLSASLFQSSQFYELRAIRDIFLPKLIADIVNELKTGFTGNQKPDLIQEMVQHLDAIKATHPLPSLSTFVAQVIGRASSSQKSVEIQKQTLTRLTQLVSILNTFPTVYFQNNERDCLVGVLVLLEVWISQGVEKGNASVEDIRFAAICRKLEARFMESRDDTLVTLYSPKVLEWLLVSVSNYEGVAVENAELAQQFLGVLKRETFFIEELTLTKLIQRISATLPKGSTCTPIEYLTATLSNLGSGNRKSSRLDLALYFIRALVSSVSGHKKHIADSNEMDVDQQQPENAANQVVESSTALLVEIEAHVLELLKQVTIGKEFTEHELDGFVAGFKVFEQLMLFKEAYGVLANTRTLTEMFDFANACLATMSQLIQGSGISNKIVDLGALFLSIQLHQLEGQETAEDIVVQDLASSSWSLLKAAWGNNPNAVSVMHGAISTFAVKCSSASIVSVLLSSVLDLVESLLPLSLGIENVLSNTPNLSAALNLLVFVISGVQKSGKRASIRKVLQRVIVDLARVVEGSANVDLTLQSVTLLTRLAEDKILEMGRSDVALVLNACTLLAAKHNPLYTASALKSGVKTYLGPDDLFDALCRLLTTILTQRREPLVDSIPAFVGVLRGLFHCFKQDLGGLRSESASTSTNIPVFISSPYPYFSKLRLDNQVLAAESLARILEKMTQKSATTSSHKETAVAHTILQTNAAATVRPFAKHAGLLVAEFVSIQSSMTPFPGAVKKALLTGVYALLDLSGEFGRKAVLAGLDTLQYSGDKGGSAAKLVFKDIVKEWENQAYRGNE